MECDIRAGRFPGEFQFGVRCDGWGETQREILLGFQNEARDILSSLISLNADKVATPEDLVDLINSILCCAYERLTSSTGFFAWLPPVGEITSSDISRAIREMNMFSVWCYFYSLESLAAGRLQVAVTSFGRAKKCHGILEVTCKFLSENLEPPLSGPAYALSNRSDQILKPGWITHCRAVIESGIDVRRLDDLLAVGGYDPSVMKITPVTLKKWAREEGIEFKPGRPKESKG